MVECALVCWSAACAASDGRRCPARIAVGRGVTGTKVTSRQVATPFASMTQGVPHWSGHPAAGGREGLSKAQIWEIYKEVYKTHPEWLKLIEPFFL